MARTKNKKKPQIGENISKEVETEGQDKSGESILKNMEKELKTESHPRKTLINPKGELSISDAISNIIAPYRDDAPNYPAFEKLVTLACAAWNAAIMPAEQRNEMLVKMRDMMPDQQSREDFVEIMTDLMNRKIKLYPDVDRLIVKFKVTDLGNDFHIAVASTLDR